MSFVIASQCDDGIDNDLDGAIDFPDDSGCKNEKDRTEAIKFGYQHGCLTHGDALYNVFGDVTYDCNHDYCGICVLMTEAGNYTTSPGKCKGPRCEFGTSGGIDETPPIITLHNPIEGEVYQEKRIIYHRYCHRRIKESYNFR